MRSNTTLKEAVKVSLYHDTRKKKDNGLFPIKIRVYDRVSKKARLYVTDFDLSQKDYNRIFFPEVGQRLRKEETEIRQDLESLKAYYFEKINGLRSFTFEELEKSLEVKSGDTLNVFYHYDTYIKDLKDSGRISTASSYELGMKSIKSYLKAKTGKEIKTLLFQDVTLKFLNGYEKWMIEVKAKSFTTVGFYLRSLRVIFNLGIESNVVNKDLYPFGVKRYEIPASSNTKKAFDSSQLTTLFRADAQTEEQAKARDFWFFSFACNGMNMKDILHLKWKNIDEGQIIFVREKTKLTKKANAKPIQVPLTDFTKSFIAKYGTNVKEPNGFIFPILNQSMSHEEQHQKKLVFIRFVNQHIKHLAKANGLTEDISTYWARHSFATSAVRKSASMEYVSEALGHSDLKTTKNYFAGFEDKTKREILYDITDFMREI
jgi:site-specific recombinase XerD